MEKENICRFIPFHKDYHSLHTLNFVLETEDKGFNGLRSDFLNKMLYVIEGEGSLQTVGETHPLRKGCLFFTFPEFPYHIERRSSDFKYMYISFLGARGNMLLKQLSVDKKNFLFPGFDELSEFWLKCIEINDPSGVISESVLLYTFGILGERLTDPKEKKIPGVKACDLIKKYVDDNYTNPELCLDIISEELKYNKKYISSLFKKEMGIGVIPYINTIRIQHACTLLSQGFYSISDISFQSGFSDAQYFSKVFKSIMGHSPKEHIVKQ